jgi:hypothetical protein
MASKKGPDRPPQAHLDPAMRGAIERLQEGLTSEGLPPKVDLKDICSALILYTSPEQAAGMLAAYWRHVANMPKSDQAATESDPAGT